MGWLSALQDPVIGSALGLIHQEQQQPRSVESLAQTVGMSRSGFAARFQALEGVPPVQYPTQWRMQIATKLLHQERKLNIGQMAYPVGYDSEASFNRAFRRISTELR